MGLLVAKPPRIVLNTPTVLSLDTNSLRSYFSSNTYFYTTSNWKQVIFYYVDSTGKQTFPVIFSPTTGQAVFKSSATVRQGLLKLTKVIVKDFDHGLVSVSRTDFPVLSDDDLIVSVPNRNPTSIVLSKTSLPENTTFVGNLTAVDPDILDTHTFSIVSAYVDGASFQIVGANALHFITAPNFEVKNQYNVKVRATDASGATYDQIFTVNVTDVNENPTNILLSSNTIYENSAINTIIGTLSVVDPDAGDSATFSIVGGDAASFNINGSQLRSSVSFDYETKASYSVVVRATDVGGLTYDKTLNISVLNVNETPTGVSISSNTVNENMAVGTVVGTLTGIDPDGGDTWTFAITGGADASSFTISGNQLKTAAVFDYEVKNSYLVTVRATDAGGLSGSSTLTINVGNVPEAPINIVISASSVPENSAVNTVIGSLSATSPASQTITYSIVGGDTSSFNISGNSLRTSASFDYETKNSYSVTVRASAGGESSDQTFTISVTNVNEPPTDILISSDTIFENNAIGDVVGTLSTASGTSKDPIASYSIISGATTKFTISGNNLLANAVFDYETQTSYLIGIRATTIYGATLDKTLTINIGNANDNPITRVETYGGTVTGGVPVYYGYSSKAAPFSIVAYLSVGDLDFGSSATSGNHSITATKLESKNTSGSGILTYTTNLNTSTGYNVYYSEMVVENIGNNVYTIKKTSSRINTDIYAWWLYITVTELTSPFRTYSTIITINADMVTQ